MENIKSKGGAEKAQIKKRKALETDAAKCATIGHFFTKSNSRLDTINEDEETAHQSRKKDPAPSTSHEPTSPEWAVSEAEPGASSDEGITAVSMEGTDQRRDTEQRVQPQDWLQPVWTRLIDGLSEANVKQLLDRLYQQDVFNAQERDVIRAQIGADKARQLIEGVQQKGPDAVSRLKTALREVNPFLYRTLNLT